MIALMTTQRSFAYVILAIVLIGGAFVVLAQMRKGKAELGSEIELAPNRKGLSARRGTRGAEAQQGALGRPSGSS
jgi:hypothetical protein